MAAASVKPEVHRDSPGPSHMTSHMTSLSVDGSAKSGVEKSSFSAMQGLVMAEDRKGKEREMNSFQNLMEYREAPASPSASSVTTSLSLENCGSPETPNSPTQADHQEMDDERLPNELLDELYEDIGMKEGMELDFVEFLMEQDMVDPQQYMTPEALRASGFQTPTNASQGNSSLNTPTNKSSTEQQQQQQQQQNWGTRNCGSPSYSIASSTNVTVATSSGSSSPVSKRFHLSNSGPPSPPSLSHTSNSATSNNHVFKAPQTPPTPRRLVPASQGAMSPRSNLSVSSNQSNHSDHSSHSNHSSVQSNSNSVNQNQSVSSRCYSPKTVPGSNVAPPQLPHSTTTPSQPFNKPPPQYGQYQGQGQTPTQQQQPQTPQQQKTPSTTNQPYQRFGKPVPPNVNVQNFQPQNNRFASSSIPHSQPGAMGNQSCAMNNSGNYGNMNIQGQTPNSQFNRPIESPLDQGYFTSSDTMSIRSYDSANSSTVPSSVTNTMHSMSNQQKVQTGTPQKSVHFADGMNMNYNVRHSEGGLPYEPCYRTNVPDCELEEYRNSLQKMQSKMMPRLNHHVKPDSAPYTVPSNNGQPVINPYEYSNSPANNAAMGNMQQQAFDYQRKPPGNNNFGMDNNQNLVMHNYNENMQQHGMNNMNCQMQGPMGTMPGQQEPGQMDPYRNQSQCQMQDPSKPAGMYDPVNMQGGMMKPGSQMSGAESNCQYGNPTQQGNMNNMMGMNQNMVNGNCGPMPNQQQGVNQNFTDGQNFQGMPQGYQPGYPGGQGQRQMHMNNMNMPGTPTSGMMGPGPQFDQTRAMPDNMNMNNMGSDMYPPNQGGNMNETVGWNGGMPQAGQQPHQMGVAPHSNPMGMHGQGMGMGQGQCGQLSNMPCAIPNCSNCKSGSPNRPPMMASQQRFIQHLITDRSNAFRSHPLFPLLRDLIIADMNFSTPNFPYQLISNLPADFDKLLQNFLHRNPPAGNYQTNFAVESVVMDALKYAHQCLIEKIRQKQDQESDKHSKSTSKSLSAIEEFCEKFDQSVRKSYIKPATLQIGGMGPGSHGNMVQGPQMGPMGPPDMGTPQKDLKYNMGMGNMMMPGGMFMSPQAKKGLEFGGMMSPGFKGLSDFDSASDCGSVVSSSSHPNKPESKKHPSLPKEAVAIMLEWLRQHKDNPYPNDDEKSMLIKQTGLTINQINYWFTNARRRILPKWAQQCKT